MNTLIAGLIIFISILHLYFMWLEMFAWTTSGKKIFKMGDDAFYEKTKPMAANQGLYNGFLAIGLLWSLFLTSPQCQNEFTIFFLGCILIAGLYGAYSVSKKIFIIQGLPALVAIVLKCFY